jgi:predicted NBD/HSP70 family sugar kinase
MRGPVSARRVFEAAAGGDERAMAVVAQEARLVAQTICAVITVVDPDLIVLGGGIGRAPGFAEAVGAELEPIAPVMPAIRVSALGTDAVVDGCLTAGAGLAWGQVMTVLAATASGDAARTSSLCGSLVFHFSERARVLARRTASSPSRASWPAGCLLAQVRGAVEVEYGSAGPFGLSRG